MTMNNPAEIIASMNKRQRREMAAILMRSDMNATGPQCRPTLAAAQASTADELLRQMRQRQTMQRVERSAFEVARVTKLLDKEGLFRFAYVPFVIAELVWDYADTVIICAKELNQPQTKPLSRHIRNARLEYNKLRARHEVAGQREREVANMYVFEDCVKSIFKQMFVNLACDIHREYPELGERSFNLIEATVQCHVLSRALLEYVSNQTAMIEAKVGHPIGSILPKSFLVVDALIPEYFGDKVPSDNFKKLMGTYIKTLAVQIALIKLNDLTELPSK